MNRSSALREQLLLWGLILGLWGLLVLGVAGQLVFTNALPWAQAFRLSLRDWLPWVVLAPAAAWLAFRFPLERPRLSISIPVHVLAGMAAVLFCELAVQPPPGPPNLPGGGPQNRFRGGVPQGEGPLFGPGRRPMEDLPGGPRPFPPEGPRPFLLNALVLRAKFNLPIYWIIVSLVHTLSYYRRSRERELTALELEGRLAEAKLQALRMQLHPHFLFNTLNAISTLVHKDPHAADEMIANLSELLRAALDTAEQEIPLRQELALLDRYLEIQQARFGERLRIEKQIDAATLEVYVPTLMLQPLVENAIRHGIEPHTATGRILLRAQVEAGKLLLAVRDNGGRVKEPAKREGGIGLANTQARLQALYGQTARLVLNSASDGGCSVELEIPVREKGGTS